MPKTVSLHTLGCKLNYVESSTIAGQFNGRGYEVRPFGERTDIFVLNTCTVTENADRECRQVIRSILRNNPDTYVIVTGCYAQLQADEISRIDGVDLVLGTNEKFSIFDFADNFTKKELSCVFTSPSSELTGLEYAYSSDIDSRTRAYLKVQDGCSYNCSFCTIPLARGRSRSVPPETVVENARKLVDSGYKEIVLTGVNTGDYSFSNGSGSYKLIDILHKLDSLDIPRIRISSIEPNLLDDGIIRLVKSSPKFCRHFHIPLQSGDPEILRLMRRRYSTEDFRLLIRKLNEELPGAGIGVDVIVGFPGETDEHFRNTYRFLDSLGISYLHVFTYSERRDTHALTLPGNVDIRERKKRSGILRELSSAKRRMFYENNTGKVHDVLFETIRDGVSIYGFTGNYIKVRTEGRSDLENRIVPVLVTACGHDKFASGKVLGTAEHTGNGTVVNPNIL